VRHLKRWQLGTGYPEIVKEVKALLARPPLPGCRLVVDATGVGRAVVDLLRAAELPAMLVPITITAGHAAAREKDGYHVAKKHLAGVLQVLLQQQRLKVSELPEREVLLREMRAFRVKVAAATGHETFEAWRERDHDDLVLSVALACWLAERGTKGPLLRVLPFGKPREKQLRVVACSREDLAGLALEQPSLLVSITDPPPVGASALPPHALPKLLDSLVLPFADLDPADHQRTWDDPVPPYGRPASELAMTREQGKLLWHLLLKRRVAAPEVLVIQDDGGRRALSLAYAVCDALRLPRTATIFRPGDSEWKAGAGDPPPNHHVYETGKSARHMVVGR
jgi:hypothetical protein